MITSTCLSISKVRIEQETEGPQERVCPSMLEKDNGTSKGVVGRSCCCTKEALIRFWEAPESSSADAVKTDVRKVSLQSTVARLEDFGIEEKGAVFEGWDPGLTAPLGPGSALLGRFQF